MKKAYPNAEIILQERKNFHKDLFDRGIYVLKEDDCPSNTCSDTSYCIDIAKSVAKKLNIGHGEYCSRNVGYEFEEVVKQFIENTLNKISDDKWRVSRLKNDKKFLYEYAQYGYLDKQKTDEYIACPDIVVSKKSDVSKWVNAVRKATNNSANVNHKPVLISSISCKWSLRTDRAQNNCKEVLDLIEKRHGSVPKIFCVIGDVYPPHLRSVIPSANSSGKIDCVYHIALPEFINALNKSKNNSRMIQEFHNYIDLGILKDISELPLDLLM